MARIHRTGVNRTAARTALSLGHAVVSGGLRRVMGRQRPPTRARDYPRWETEPGFGDATWVIGQKPGTLLKSSPMRLLGTEGSLNPATAHRIEYVTTDARGHTITATGAYFHSHSRWRGGSRPVVAFAPSTQGVAKHCDPSYSCTVGASVFRTRPVDIIAAYELPVTNLLLAAGCHVVITDYPRDPDLQLQLYCDHTSGAHSLIDAVRASHVLGLPQEAPVGMWGFSQGGGTVAQALEDPTYAPDMRVKAAVVGAPPARLEEVLRHVDGSLVTGVLAYATAGLMVTSPEIHEEIFSVLTPEGITKLLNYLATCAGGSVLASGWQSSATWTRNGATLGSLLEDLPAVSKEFEARHLGRAKPSAPVLLWGSTNDDVVPIGIVRDLNRRWRRLGGDVTWREDRTPHLPGRTGFNHFGPYYRRLADDVGWLLDQLRR
ncbi:putative inactive lipase [Corynebacterium atrinae]|uniref:lipase family protein n=1 Tax=Corynebacterium atrinae TaxID=1336740 RepID=UPI0025B353F3|nr:lipase family protein [Corynebacterium atrinae]WJY63378.1 putative inactive lipase [Corynebacterium atrinae]